MAEHSRYYVSDNDASVSKGILKNKLGIKSRKKLSEAETLLLADTYTHFFEYFKLKFKPNMAPNVRVYEKFAFRIYWINFVNWLNPILFHISLFYHPTEKNEFGSKKFCTP